MNATPDGIPDGIPDDILEQLTNVLGNPLLDITLTDGERKTALKIVHPDVLQRAIDEITQLRDYADKADQILSSMPVDLDDLLGDQE